MSRSNNKTENNRPTKRKKSVLDVFLVCDQALPFVRRMLIDENRENPLTNFLGINKKLKKKKIN